LPVTQRNNRDKDEPDWEFMEKYIEYIINRLSLSGNTIFTKINEIKIPSSSEPNNHFLLPLISSNNTNQIINLFFH
jgi:hypothetical protein